MSGRLHVSPTESEWTFKRGVGIFGFVEATFPALQPLFRSRAVAEMLALLFLNPSDEYSLTDVARHTGASVPTVHAEVNRLISAGLATDRRVGNVRLVRANMAVEQAAPLRELLAVTYGPRPAVARAVAGRPGVVRAFISGAWADRQTGRLERVPDDVSVVLIGMADAYTLRDVRQQIESELDCDAHIRLVSEREWDDAMEVAERGAPTPTGSADADLVALVQGPLISVTGPSLADRPDEQAVATEVATVASVAPEPAATNATEEPPAPADDQPETLSIPTSSSIDREPRCPFLEIGPAMVRCLTAMAAAAPTPPSLSSAAGAAVSAAHLGWLPWDAFPLRMLPVDFARTD